MNSNFVVTICGREAIPVRAIPFVTGWMMPPDLLAKALAHKDLARRFEKSWAIENRDAQGEGSTKIPARRAAQAHHLRPDGTSAPMQPKEWDCVVDDIEILTTRLKEAEQTDGENFKAWRHEATLLLPPGVFVWKDEFEKLFARAYAPLTGISRGDLDERQGERDLNFAPYIPHDLPERVVEGFKQQPAVRESSKAEDTPTAAQQTADAVPALPRVVVEAPTAPEQEHGALPLSGATPATTANTRRNEAPIKTIRYGETKAAILSTDWPIPSGAPSLENILDDIPKWVNEACTRVGRPGKGPSGSHLWNPALLAVCLATKTPQKQWSANIAALNRVIRNDFNEYLDQWSEAKERL